MKNVFLFAALFLTINIPIFAQSLTFELDKIRQIKMLESTRDDVKRILSGYKSDVAENDDEPDYSETFSSEKIDVEISYTTGDCSDDADDTDEWKVAKGKVKFIEISFNDSVKFEELILKTSDFQKEQRYADREDDFVYHDKDKGIAFIVDEDGINEIHLFPVKKQSTLLCKNEEAENFKTFYSKESYFGDVELKDRVIISCAPAYVSDLTLSATEITASCSALDSVENKNCSNSPRLINVSTVANDPEDDTLVYHYTVSGGRIVGTGKDVMWDLADVKPGKYTITAGVDDGCGICGETKTKEVVVK